MRFYYSVKQIGKFLLSFMLGLIAATELVYFYKHPIGGRATVRSRYSDLRPAVNWDPPIKNSGEIFRPEIYKDAQDGNDNDQQQLLKMSPQELGLDRQMGGVNPNKENHVDDRQPIVDKDLDDRQNQGDSVNKAEQYPNVEEPAINIKMGVKAKPKKYKPGDNIDFASDENIQKEQQNERNGLQFNAEKHHFDGTIQSDPPHCAPLEPCEYESEVDLRIIVLTQKRWESLVNTLNSLLKLVTDGDHVVMEIWIDRLKDGSVHEQTYRVAREYVFKKIGAKRVHVWDKNVGILGQWIDTWRPQPGTKEIGIIIEDDIDVSPYFYRWLKHTKQTFGHYDMISGYTLQDENIWAGKKFLQREVTDPMFMYRLHGCWGFAPHPDRWRDFQDWYHQVSKDPNFHPYVPLATKHDGWYRNFERHHTQQHMWEMWYYKYAADKQLWAVHNNLRTYAQRSQGLSFNRREPGLHFKRKKGLNSGGQLLDVWLDHFVDFPAKIKMYDYNGKATRVFERDTGDIIEL